MSTYWEEVVIESFDDCGLSATEDQIDIVVKMVASAHECYGMMHGLEIIDTKPPNEIEVLKNKVIELEGRRPCQEPGCDNGYVAVSVGTSHSSSATCLKCSGKGWI